MSCLRQPFCDLPFSKFSLKRPAYSDCVEKGEELVEFRIVSRGSRNGDIEGLDRWFSYRYSMFPHFLQFSLEADRGVEWKTVKVQSGHEEVTFTMSDKPRTVTFNPGNDIPVPRKNFYVFSNYFDDFDHSILVYGTSRQVEANHTLAVRYQTVLADAFTEILPPVKKDCEVTAAELASSDIILLGGVADNRLTGQLAEKAGMSLGKDMFVWKGKTYAAPDDGVIVTLPNPYNPARMAYFIIANSALQLWQMTKRNPSVPSWGVFKGEKVVEKGYHPVEGMQIAVE